MILHDISKKPGQDQPCMYLAKKHASILPDSGKVIIQDSHWKDLATFPQKSCQVTKLIHVWGNTNCIDSTWL